MAQHFATRSFNGRSACLITVIPGSASEWDGNNSDNEEDSAPLEVNYDSEDSDHLPQNVVSEDDVGSDDSKSGNETARATTSQARPKGRNGPSKDREAEFSWRKKVFDAVEIQEEETLFDSR